MTTSPSKPRVPKLGAEKLTPEEQLKRFHDAVDSPARGDVPKDKPSRSSVKKLTSEE